MLEKDLYILAYPWYVSSMITIGLFSVIVTPDLAASQKFYGDFFGLQTAFVSSWYLQLIHPTMTSLQLGLIIRDHESMPAPDQDTNAAAIVTVEVESADTVHHLMITANADVRSSPRDEPWGQRHFFARDPAGHWVDVVQRIEPSPEYRAAYVVAQ